MIRAVFDANILVSGFAATTGTLPTLIGPWREGEFQIVISQQILDEVERTWLNPYWQVRFAPALSEQALTLLHQEAEVTALTAMVTGVASHVEDDQMLATAVSAQVDYLVTGDRQLQRLDTFRRSLFNDARCPALVPGAGDSIRPPVAHPG